MLAFAVTDTGIGIDDEQQPRIFEAFAQGDGTTSRVYGGTGLGLSISRELVGLLGGDIDVASTVGEGSTFTVYLPEQALAATPPTTSTVAGPVSGDVPAAAPPASNGHGPAAAPPSAPSALTQDQEVHRVTGLSDRSAEGVRFLVVDDDARNLFAMGTLLEHCGADVTVVDSGAAAMAALDEASGFDIVLMDIMMPVMDGYRPIRAIRRLERFRSLTVIAVTGKVMAGERSAAWTPGRTTTCPSPWTSPSCSPHCDPGCRSPVQRQRPRLGRPVASSRAILVDADSRAPFSIGDRRWTGCSILVVDDDFRNIFAMTAILERGNAIVTAAESGADAIAALGLTPEIDIVLMDIMMPVMDGYDTIRAIRQMAGFQVAPHHRRDRQGRRR